MFKSIKRLHFLKGLSNDGIILSSGSSNWIQIIRKCSGVMEKKEDIEEGAADDLYFTEFLRQRQEEARRSVIIQITNNNLWSELKQMCIDNGYMKKYIEYKEQDIPFVLLEMISEDKLSEFLSENQSIQNSSRILNQFVKLKESQGDSRILSLVQESADVYSKIPKTEKKVKVDNMVKLVSKGEDNVSKGLCKMYRDLALSDLGVRLRFLMCRQMETFCSGFIQNPIAYPFGSSVTGFGINGCDLDIALVPSPVLNSSFSQENFSFMHRVTIREHITAVAELMKLFMIGCSELVLIRNAKVPIVKYKNSFTNVECDLSLYNLHGVAMSQLLYTMSLIDDRVKPLVIALKLWANNVGIVSKIPRRPVTNFQLALLVIFYLQTTNILPPAEFFPCTNEILCEDESFRSTLNKYKLIAKTNTKTLGELYHEFFKFYANFNFKKHGICVKNGKVINNAVKNSLFIENPLTKGVNVSVNVDVVETEKLSFHFKSMFRKVQKSELLFNVQNMIQQGSM